MVKGIRLDWNPWSLHKHSHIYVKFAVSLLLVGLAFRLVVSRSGSFWPATETPYVEKVASADAPASTTTLEIDNQASNTGNSTDKCDLFVGDWVPDPMGPAYTNESCHVLEGHQNCMKNGRPDNRYLFWRWKPLDCELPQFDSRRFLGAMQNKHWAFVGDSISRNHVQSLLCMLSQVAEVTEVYHDKEYKSKRWYFPSYNFTVSVVWSPFLIKASIFEDINGVSTSDIQLNLDLLDSKWTDQYSNFDYMIISGGKWFLKTAMYREKGKVIGCHNCLGKNLTELGFYTAYRKAIQLVFNFTATSDHKASVLFRTSTPDHFENGEWFSGGTCKRMAPFKEGDISLNDVDTRLRSIELEEFEKAKTSVSGRGVDLRLLDTTGLSLLRPDGHPGPYRQFHPFSKDKNARVQNDCLHWCLPGPIDNWNDLVMELVLND
ncbi:protein trichome birefringence-like 25 [Aristolochia californica]|uniref:protein trichome birefringence-like 25 n=1 Tax=Aristolochia californica TaxID=171875 RepID=UPI0035E04D84